MRAPRAQWQDGSLFGFDLTGNNTKLIDPDGNVNLFGLDQLGRQLVEAVVTGVQQWAKGLKDSVVYDLDGNVVRSVDRNGRVTDYKRDAWGRVTDEFWFKSLADANTYQAQPSGNEALLANHVHYEFDGSRLVSAGDNNSTYAYGNYDGLDRAATETFTAGTLGVQFAYGYGDRADGNAVTVSAAVKSISPTGSTAWTADYHNAYEYDSQGRVKSVTQSNQSNQSNGHAVAYKKAAIQRDTDGRLQLIERFSAVTDQRQSRFHFPRFLQLKFCGKYCDDGRNSFVAAVGAE